MIALSFELAAHDAAGTFLIGYLIYTIAETRKLVGTIVLSACLSTGRGTAYAGEAMIISDCAFVQVGGTQCCWHVSNRLPYLYHHRDEKVGWDNRSLRLFKYRAGDGLRRRGSDY
jgi:hypothetical protein